MNQHFFLTVFICQIISLKSSSSCVFLGTDVIQNVSKFEPISERQLTAVSEFISRQIRHQWRQYYVTVKAWHHSGSLGFQGHLKMIQKDFWTLCVVVISIIIISSDIRKFGKEQLLIVSAWLIIMVANWLLSHFIHTSGGRKCFLI